jgi:ATP-dependent RNA circularization protein (DNA/RNA ligase family)
MRKFPVICSHMTDNPFTVKKIHKSITFEFILVYNSQIIYGDISGRSQIYLITLDYSCYYACINVPIFYLCTSIYVM